MSANQSAADIFNKNASIYQQKYMDVSLYHDTFDAFCELVRKENASILDIACGPGNITKYVLQKRPDYNILCTDLAPNMLELAKQNNPSVTTALMDAREISTLNIKFDGIICGFCMPYLSKGESIKLIADAAGLLHNGGALYISTMEDDYSRSGIQRSSQGDEIYMYFHEAGYLVSALEEKGFDNIQVRTQNFTQFDGTVTKDLILIAVKQAQ